MTTAQHSRDVLFEDGDPTTALAEHRRVATALLDAVRAA